MTDQYLAAAEYIDVMSRGAWQYLAPALTTVLTTANPVVGPIVDVGAGTGLGTIAIADAAPDTDIIAVEPSAALRAVLLTRVVDDAALASRVTVLDTDLQHAELPYRLGGLVAMNMIGHLAPDARRRLWTMLAQRLPPDAPAVLNLQPPETPTTVPDTRFTTVTVGRRVYEGWGRAEPRDQTSVTWHMRYRTYQQDSLIGERTIDHRWWTLSPQQLRAEVSEHDLTLEAVGAADARIYKLTNPHPPHRSA